MIEGQLFYLHPIDGTTCYLDQSPCRMAELDSSPMPATVGGFKTAADARAWVAERVGKYRTMLKIVDKPRYFKAGDVIRATAFYRSYTLRVTSAINYGTMADPDWYIEGRVTNTGESIYIKQKIDHAVLEYKFQAP